MCSTRVMNHNQKEKDARIKILAMKKRQLANYIKQSIAKMGL